MIERYLALSYTEKQELLSQTAIRLGVDPIIVEKDFWVCAILREIFTHSEMRNHFIFKGGTSLSKVYGLIQRFSEDIDLIIDWRLLGLGPPDHDPWDVNRSRTKQDAFNKSVATRTEEYLRGPFVTFLGSVLPDNVHVSASTRIQQGIEIQYPAVYPSDYIREGVLLEIGPLASWTPSTWKTIVPEVSKFYPQVVGDTPITVNVTTAERTFWEKVTIAHWIASSGKTIPARYARHYYDIIMLTRAGIAEKAMEDKLLLPAVVDFKQKFYWSKSAHYDRARPGTLRIVPDQPQLTELERDYRDMEAMFYRSPPDWSQLVDQLRALEATINKSERT